MQERSDGNQGRIVFFSTKMVRALPTGRFRPHRRAKTGRVAGAFAASHLARTPLANTALSTSGTALERIYICLLYTSDAADE